MAKKKNKYLKQYLAIVGGDNYIAVKAKTQLEAAKLIRGYLNRLEMFASPEEISDLVANADIVEIMAAN